MGLVSSSSEGVTKSTTDGSSSGSKSMTDGSCSGSTSTTDGSGSHGVTRSMVSSPSTIDTALRCTPGSVVGRVGMICTLLLEGAGVEASSEASSWFEEAMQNDKNKINKT